MEEKDGSAKYGLSLLTRDNVLYPALPQVGAMAKRPPLAPMNRQRLLKPSDARPPLTTPPWKEALRLVFLLPSSPFPQLLTAALGSKQWSRGRVDGPSSWSAIASLAPPPLAPWTGGAMTQFAHPSNLSPPLPILLQL